MTEFANIELALIEPSLTNPRKTFNTAKLADLTASIKASGVHQPVLVRPLPGSRVADTPRGVQYELVCGERRYRASVDAGVATIPALVRALTDITGKIGDAWDVTFRGRSGGISSFMADQISVVVA